jgi:hypothetical protein
MATTVAEQQLNLGSQKLLDARSNLAVERIKLEQYKQQVNTVDVPKRNLLFQFGYVRSGKVPLNRSAQYVRSRKNYRTRAYSQIKQIESELNKYEAEQLNPYEAQLTEVSKQIEEYKSAQIRASKRKEKRDIRNYPIKQEYYAEIKKYKDLGLTPIIVDGKVTGFEDSVSGKSYPIGNLPEVVTKYRPEELQVFLDKGLLTKQTSEPSLTNTTPTFAEISAQQSLAPEYRTFGKPGQFNEPRQYSSSVLGKIEQRTMELREKENKNIGDYGLQVVGGFLYGGVESIRGVRDLGIGLYTQPVKTIKGIPRGIYESGKNIFNIIRTQPAEGVGRVGFELLALKGAGKALKSSGKVAEIGSAKLSFKYTKVIGDELKIIGKDSKPITIKLADDIPTETLKSQLDLQGGTVTAVSGQRDLFSPLANELEVNKPIPISTNYKGLSESTLKQLEGLKYGKDFSLKQIENLNIAVKKETGSKGLLETSFFADPRGRLRPKRLVLKEPQEVSIIDVLRNKVSLKDISFRKNKPQAIVFEKTVIEKIPRNVKTPTQLLKFQQARSGKFKPVGFLTPESEITLAPGEIIRKVRKSGVTIISGRKVSIYSAEVLNPKIIKKSTYSLANKGNKNLLDKIKLKSNNIYYPYSDKKYYLSTNNEFSKISQVSLRNYESKYYSKLNYKYSSISIKPYTYKSKYSYSGKSSLNYKYSSGKSYNAYNPKINYAVSSPAKSPKPYSNSFIKYPPKYTIKPSVSVRPSKKYTRPIIKVKIKIQDKYKQKPFRPKSITRYTPSFTAASLRITGSRKPMAGKNTYLPGIRPIIIRKQRKRKI